MEQEHAVRRCAPLARVKHRLVVAGLLIASAACGVPPPEIRTWTEEVQLSDGRVATVERQERYHTTQEFGGLGELHTDGSRLSLLLPDGTKLPPLEVGEMPLVFDTEPGGTFFAITIVDYCTRAKELGLDTRTPYFEYRLAGPAWTRAPVSDGKVGWKTNLLIHRSAARDDKSISLQDKAKADASPGTGLEYRAVLSNGAPC